MMDCDKLANTVSCATSSSAAVEETANLHSISRPQHMPISKSGLEIQLPLYPRAVTFCRAQLLYESATHADVLNHLASLAVSESLYPVVYRHVYLQVKLLPLFLRGGEMSLDVACRGMHIADIYFARCAAPIEDVQAVQYIIEAAFCLAKRIVTEGHVEARSGADMVRIELQEKMVKLINWALLTPTMLDISEWCGDAFSALGRPSSACGTPHSTTMKDGVVSQSHHYSQHSLSPTVTTPPSCAHDYESRSSQDEFHQLENSADSTINTSPHIDLNNNGFMCHTRSESESSPARPQPHTKASHCRVVSMMHTEEYVSLQTQSRLSNHYTHTGGFCHSPVLLQQQQRPRSTTLASTTMPVPFPPLLLAPAAFHYHSQHLSNNNSSSSSSSSSTVTAIPASMQGNMRHVNVNSFENTRLVFLLFHKSLTCEFDAVVLGFVLFLFRFHLNDAHSQQIMADLLLPIPSRSIWNSCYERIRTAMAEGSSIKTPPDPHHSLTLAQWWFICCQSIVDPLSSQFDNDPSMQ